MNRPSGSRRQNRLQGCGQQGAISLLLALLVAGAALLGTVVFTLAKLRDAEHQLGVMAADQGSAVLSCYDRGLMDRYGMLAYRSDVPDRLGQVFEASDVPGSVLLEMTPNARLTEADALELQIRQFMSGRLPVRLAERFAAMQQSVRSGIETADRQALCGPDVLNGGRLLAGWAEATGELADDSPDASDAAEGEASGRTGASGVVSGENWSDAEAGRVNSLVARLREAAETAASYSEITNGAAGSLLDFKGLSETLALADRLTDGGLFPGADALSVTEYGIGMFRSQIHQVPADFDSPYRHSLRQQDLCALPSRRSNALEYLIFGLEDDAANAGSAKASLFGIRLAMRLTDYHLSGYKMAEARGTATLISAAVALLSTGAVSIPPETLSTAIWVIESASDAWRDCRSMLAGRTAPLFGYSRDKTVDLYYHDYMRLLLMAVNREIKLIRMAELMEADADSALYTGISVRLDWQAPVDLVRHVVLRQDYVTESAGGKE